MTVLVSFDYEPDEPDDTDPTGVSSDEFDRLTDQLMEIGADNIVVRKKAE
jgi:hypothetical protein